MSKRSSNKSEQVWYTGHQLCKLLGIERTTLWRWKKHRFFPEADITIVGQDRYDIRKVKVFLQSKL
ncbi:hypothetical protein D5R81_12550 [Parashewanella spongiae]|uniref:DNA-binding protein n=1 Tax=Parashewanella spongiae TaxID=342950 RepID=A0A3A6TTZ1_9GAMM|nr:hypothetical protein [Parashewanella spongiae]MCL1078713.1 hypothetical protein [Parashewanella spongiae]RJY12284.1 hypothetical protein D5R81_12550 [Parashewanella spongiae]